MEQKQARNIDRASEGQAESARQSFQMLADRTVALQESNLRLTQNFFQNFVEQLQSQTERNRQATENLQEQGQRQRESIETLSEEATNVYSDFLNSALSFYQEALSTATQVAQRNMQNAAQFTQQHGIQATNQAAQKRRESMALGYAGSNRTDAIQLIDELLAEDPSYDKETWPEIAEALDRDRPSARKLFVD